MQRSLPMDSLALCFTALLVLADPDLAAMQQKPISPVPAPIGELHVLSTTPARITIAPTTTAVSVSFDRALRQSSISSATFRVRGRSSGTASGTYQFTPDGRQVTFTPLAPFAAGELVSVELSHDIKAIDFSPLRSAGYAFQFTTAVTPSAGQLQQVAVMSNNTGEQTRIYGAAAADLNGDRFIDLTTVNEVSADLRVFLNLADGTGAFSSFLTPEPIGDEASPNEAADFDNDGRIDLCTSATDSQSVWIVLGNGDGSFAAPQEVPVGLEPHGIAVLDVDGDADLDIVNANNGSGNLSLLVNDGSGFFAAPLFFDGGVNGEYGLAAADVNADGITDLVVSGETGSHLLALLGNGDGTFTPAGSPQSTGGATWVVQLGDVNGDGKLDASTANSGSGNGSILIGNGAGGFGAPTIANVGAFTVSSDLADLEGDGDLDWILSSFGGGFWRIYRNDGAGGFSFWRQITAPSNPSCAVPLDIDNDGDVDLALTDEIADVVVIMRNS